MPPYSALVVFVADVFTRMEQRRDVELRQQPRIVEHPLPEIRQIAFRDLRPFQRELHVGVRTRWSEAVMANTALSEPFAACVSPTM